MFMKQDMKVPKISISGLRTAERIRFWYKFWILVTSVVRRVTREPVPNESIAEKENDWTFLKRFPRRFFEKPNAASAESLPQPAPQHKEKTDIRTIRSPNLTTYPKSFEPIPTSTIFAMTRGIVVSIRTSPSMKTGERTVKTRYFFSRPKVSFLSRFMYSILFQFKPTCKKNML